MSAARFTLAFCGCFLFALVVLQIQSLKMQTAILDQEVESLKSAFSVRLHTRSNSASAF